MNTRRSTRPRKREQMTKLEALKRNNVDKSSRSLTEQINAHELPEVFEHVEQAYGFGSEETEEARDAYYAEDEAYHRALDQAYRDYDRRRFDTRRFSFDRQKDHPALRDPRAA